MADHNNQDDDIDQLELPSLEAVISLANRLLEDFNIEAIITEIEDISANFFVVLFERLFSLKLPGIIRQPESREDDIHNCQIVIDVLSTDIVHDSLSHITGVEIVNQDINVIFHLLDIFSFLFEYVSNKIESDAPTDNDVFLCPYIESKSAALSDGDLSGLSRSMDSGRLRARGNSPLSRNNVSKERTIPKNIDEKKRINLNTNENRNVISEKDLYETSDRSKGLQRAPSPIKLDDSQSFLGYKTIDSEFSVENLEKKVPSSAPSIKSSLPGSPKTVWTENVDDLPAEIRTDRKSANSVGETSADQLKSSDTKDRHTNGTTHFTFTHHFYHHFKHPTIKPDDMQKTDKNFEPTDEVDDFSQPEERLFKKPDSTSFSASLPVKNNKQEYVNSDRLRATVGPIPYTPTTTPEKILPHKSDVKGFSSSLDDLRHLVEKTAAMTRFALESSPVRSKTMQELDLNDPYIDRPRPTIPGEGARLAKELNLRGFNSNHHSSQSATRVGKRVAFAPTDLRSEYEYQRSPLATLSANNIGYSSDYSSDKDSDQFLDEERDFRNAINQKKISYGDPTMNKTKLKRKPRSKPSKGKTPSLVTHLARNRQPELGAAHMTLKTEDRALARKQNILKKMYDEDLEEFTDEVKHMLDKEFKKSQETGDLFKKNCQTTANQTMKKAKGNVAVSTCKKPRIGSTKTKKQLSSASEESVTDTAVESAAAAVTPWHLQSEEDLLPLLLEEFPHLHLSDHTWHELWRRGLRQIQSLTHAYANAQQKKSREQSQLEEAAQRHEMLGSLMKKQLDHGKRLREIKDQKQLQAHLKNRAHEQKIQSARARRYYNEYQVRARGKQLKKRTKEEMVFRELFKEALDIQKERIKDIRKYASDQRKRQESRRQNEIDSMENFYRDQFDMLSERLSKERYETEVRETAQKKMLGQMKRELRKKMESEIKSYQDNLLKDDDQAHWRRVDANRVKQQLHLARYSAKI